MDEVTSPEALIDASPEVVARYLESAGVNLAALDASGARFAKSLPGRVALARAGRQPRTNLSRPESDLSGFSDADLMSRLVEIYGSQEKIPIAARTKKALTRRELESLFRDATDKF